MSFTKFIVGNLFPLIVAALSGLTMAVQGSMNSVLGKYIGLWEATWVVHLVGLMLVSLLLFVMRVGDGHLANFQQAPWYTFLGGILSVGIIYGVVTSIPRLGVANATTAIIVGQVLTAVIIDHLGLFGVEKIPFSWWQFLGLVLLAVGARCLLR